MTQHCISGKALLLTANLAKVVSHNKIKSGYVFHILMQPNDDCNSE